MVDKAVCFQCGAIEVSPGAFAVLRDGQRVNLEPKAIRVLIHLIENRDRAVSKDELVETVWEGTAVTDNAVTRVIAQIRRELADDPKQPRFIETLPTLGYRFIAEVREIRGEADPPPAADLPVTVPTRRTGRWLAAGAAVLAIPAGWWAMGRLRGAAAGEPRVKQLTTTSGLDAGASFGPGGRRFVYSSNRSGAFELYRREAGAAGAMEQVTGDGMQNIQPAWSPDGKWIAYHSAARRGIWVVAAAGGEPRRVTDFGSAPAWSPDSRAIAFSAAEPHSLAPFDPGDQGTIWKVALDGSALRQVTNSRSPRGTHGSPAWSPDGKRLLFASLSRNSGIHEVDLVSGETRPIVLSGRDIPRRPGTWVSRLWDPKYAPDGQSVYFSAAGDNGEYAIWVLPGPGEAPRRLFTSRAETPTGLAVAPDGGRLLFTLARNVSRLWTVDQNGESKPVFQDEVLRAHAPSYSPDGKWLAFAVETQGRARDVWVMPAAGGEPSPVSADPGPKEAGMAWTPAGELLYNYVTGADVEFRAYDPASGRTRTIARRTAAGTYHPQLMPNARDLMCACSEPMNVCVGPVNRPGVPRQITFDRERAWFPMADRAGEWLVYQVARGDTTQIGLVRPDGTGGRLLTNDAARNWPYSFSGDGRRIAFASMQAGVWNLWWIDRETGERRQLTRETAFGPFVRSPAWHPDSNRLVYEWYQVRGNVFELGIR